MLNKKDTIIVADRIEFFRQTMSEILNKYDCNTILTEDTEETEENIRENKGKVKLVILDLHIPPEGGFELIEKIRTLSSDIEIIVTTDSLLSSESRSKLDHYNISGIIHRSTPPEEIMFNLNKFLFPEEKNSRRAKRIPVNQLVEYRMEESVFNAYIYTLSKKGLFIRTTNPESPGTRLDIAFSLPGMEDMIYAQGKVVHRKLKDSDEIHPPGMGVEFSSVSPSDRETIVEYIESRSEQ